MGPMGASGMDPPPADEEAEAAAAAWGSTADTRAEAAALARQQEQFNVSTLSGMFPEVDPVVCQLVLENCHGDLEKSIEKLMLMN